MLPPLADTNDFLGTEACKDSWYELMLWKPLYHSLIKTLEQDSSVGRTYFVRSMFSSSSSRSSFLKDSLEIVPAVPGRRLCVGLPMGDFKGRGGLLLWGMMPRFCEGLRSPRGLMGVLPYSAANFQKGAGELVGMC